VSRAARIGTCNRYPRVWAAMLGCEGSAPFAGWEGARSAGGSARACYTCATCGAFGALTATLNAPEHQDLLSQVQDAAGVSDYRYQATVRGPDKRPALTWRATGQVLALPSILERWPAFVPVRA
jgi:hypothetical protein